MHASDRADTPSLVARAIAAYYRFGLAQKLGELSASATALAELAGKQYVVMRTDQRDVLTVYRVRNDGVLKRLVRWPSELATELATSPTATPGPAQRPS